MSPPAQSGLGTVAALVLFIVASLWIGALANRAMRRGTFLKGFFLGNRGLGAWALALTATVQSGGTFMGFPSLVYTHGWAVALWIAGYMVVPITGFGILGKRIAELSRRTGAITVPDLFRSRFGSPALGLIASLFILFYMSFMMVAQFKAGALVMKLSWPGSGALALSEDATSYQLDASRLDALELPRDVRARLQPILGTNFKNEAEAAAALESTLPPHILEEHKGVLLAAMKPFDYLYLTGLAIFTLTVVGYTLLGGFLAAVWTDLFQSVMMGIGVMLLLVLALHHAGGLDNATRRAIENTGPEYAVAPGYVPSQAPKPGEPPQPERKFLPIGLAFSFFCVWVLAGAGSPAGVVRIMACKSTGTIRRSIYLLSLYNCCIYIPLIVICICGRALIPDLPPGQTDEIIPRMALGMTASLPGGSFLGGLILAAPFGAVMATVSSYLVVIASGLVRDVYQRWINPGATESALRRLSYLVMIAVGVIAVVANIRPVAYLQAIVVFSGTGAAATFLVPLLMLAYWRRASVPGTIAAMLSGAGAMLGLYVAGFLGAGGTAGQLTSFRPYYLLTLDPMIWGLLTSVLVGVTVSLASSPPDESVVSPLFDAPAADPLDANTSEGDFERRHSEPSVALSRLDRGSE